MSRKRRQKLSKSECDLDFIEQMKEEYNYPLVYTNTDYIWWYFATIDLFNPKRISQEEMAREAKTHIFNRDKKKTKNKYFWKKDFTIRRRYSYKSPNRNGIGFEYPVFSYDRWYDKHFKKDYQQKKFDESCKFQIDEYYREVA